MLPGLAVRLRQEGLVLLKCFMVSQKSSFAELVTDLNGYSAVQGRLVFSMIVTQAGIIRKIIRGSLVMGYFGDGGQKDIIFAKICNCLQ